MCYITQTNEPNILIYSTYFFFFYIFTVSLILEIAYLQRTDCCVILYKKTYSAYFLWKKYLFSYTNCILP